MRKKVIEREQRRLHLHHDLVALEEDVVDIRQAELVFLYFFFSSRRRHTRCGRDWSSDVCSSDLGIQLNKTSRNSVLFQTNINNTLSDVAHLLKVLGEIAGGLDEQLTRGTDGERAVFK